MTATAAGGLLFGGLFTGPGGGETQLGPGAQR